MSEKFKVKFRETNHRFDVKFTETMNINADRVLKPITIIQNGVYKADETTAYSPITVAVPEPVIEPLTVTENGTYTAEDCDGYSPVKVEIKGLVTKAQALKGLVDAKQSAKNLFESCRMSDEELKEYLEFNVTENAKSFQHMFLNSMVTEIPAFDIKNATELNSTFMVCSALVSPPMLDTAHIVNFNSVLNQSASIKIIPSWDVRSGTKFNQAFTDDFALEEIWWRNIKANLQVGSGTSYGRLLTLESLIHLIKELRDTGTLLTLTIGSANLAKLENIYVRTIPITDEMREQDDLIDEKLPFEICESTDEGAVLISEYVVSKNWQLA